MPQPHEGFRNYPRPEILSTGFYPRIDETSPLYEGMIGAWTAWTGSGEVEDLIGSNTLTRSGGPTWTQNALLGPHLACDYNKGLVGAERPFANRTQWTFCIRLQLRDGVGSSDRLGVAGQNSVAGSTDDWRLVFANSPDIAQWHPYDTAGLTGNYAVVSGRYISFVLVFDSGVTDGTQMWASGVLNSTATQTGTTGDTEDFQIGMGFQGLAPHINFIEAFAWDRPLTEDEAYAVSNWSSEMWWNPHKQRLFVVKAPAVAAAGLDRRAFRGVARGVARGI